MKLLYFTLLASAMVAASLTAQEDPAASQGKMAEMKGKMGGMQGTMGGMQDKMGGMMGEMKGKMMGDPATATADMADDHREMTQLVEKLAQSLTALEAEHDHGELLKKLAEHRKIVEQIQALVAKHGPGSTGGSKSTAPTEHQH